MSAIVLARAAIRSAAALTDLADECLENPEVRRGQYERAGIAWTALASDLVAIDQAAFEHEMLRRLRAPTEAAE
jgi:hypothetical protein